MPASVNRLSIRRAGGGAGCEKYHLAGASGSSAVGIRGRAWSPMGPKSSGISPAPRPTIGRMASY